MWKYVWLHEWIWIVHFGGKNNGGFSNEMKYRFAKEFL